MSGKKPLNPDMHGQRKGWKWADGKVHPEPPPPGREPKGTPESKPPEFYDADGNLRIKDGVGQFIAMEVDTSTQSQAFLQPPPPSSVGFPGAQLPKRPDVPPEFTPTPRYLLRYTALDFALRAASIMHGRVADGAEILKEAEEIERWLAEPQALKSDTQPPEAQNSTPPLQDGESTTAPTSQLASSSSKSSEENTEA